MSEFSKLDRRPMIKVIIIDDETKAQEILELMLERYLPGKFQVVAKCSSVDEGVQQILRKKPDLLFLDIQMPNKNGFAIFDEIKFINFDIVFTTAYEEHAVRAINTDNRVFGYLLKPIHPEDLKKLIIRFEEKRHQESLVRKLDNITENMGNLGILAFNTQEGTEFIQHDEIAYCEAEGNYTTIFKINGTKLLISKNLGIIEEKLPIEQFIRIHHGILVNVKQIMRIDKKEDYVILRNGDKLSGSTRRMKDLKKYFAY